MSKPKIIFKHSIPDEYPSDLSECLKILEDVKYRSMGFPMVYLVYLYNFKKWECSFRNPIDFDNPKTESDQTIEAIHKMFDFIRIIGNEKE
jgi:hypothetical protein